MLSLDAVFVIGANVLNSFSFVVSELKVEPVSNWVVS